MSLIQALTHWDGKSNKDIQAIYDQFHNTPIFVSSLIDELKVTEVAPGITWLLKHHLENSAQLTGEEQKQLVHLGCRFEHWSAQLHFLQILPYLDLSIENCLTLEPFVRYAISSHNKFVRAWAYNGFYLIARINTLLQSEAIEFLSQALEDEPASVKARVKKCLKQGFPNQQIEVYMKSCVFLSMDDLNGLPCYDELAVGPLNAIGWQVSTIPWRSKNIDWAQFDLVIIRSTWDYQDHEQEFLTTLNEIKATGTLIANDVETVAWNVNKKYLSQLAQQGAPIVPTVWMNTYSLELIHDSFDKFSCDEIVIKPCVSAGSSDTYRIKKSELAGLSSTLAQCFHAREAMIQPFLKDIVKTGEYSLFFFNNKLSHCILKKPESGDFRVQEEFGGLHTLIEPDEKLLQAALRAIENLSPTPLYVRVDMAIHNDDYVLMELELIEPSLYFNMAPESAETFANAVNDYHNKMAR